MRERKPIDAALRLFLDEQAVALGPPVEMTDEARTRMVRERMVRALESRAFIPGLPNEVKTHEVNIAAGLAARLYLPSSGAQPLPVLVYLPAAAGLPVRVRATIPSAAFSARPPV